MTFREFLKQYSTFRKLAYLFRPAKTQRERDNRAARLVDYLPVHGGIILLKNRKNLKAAFYPYKDRHSVHQAQLRILSFGFDEHLRRKYTNEAWAIQPDDTVIDCGGFIGGFSIAAHKAGATRVIHIEPTPISRKCAAMNFALHECDNIQMVPAGLGEDAGTATLNLSASGSDNSLLDPDEGATGRTIEIDLKTVDGIANDMNLDPQHTFAKIEAEGFEVEIVKGMKTFFPRVVVVDVTPERGGVSPDAEIRALLESKGYTNFLRTDRCLFAGREAP